MSRTDRISIAAAGGALVLAVAAAWLLLVPATGHDAPDEASLLLPSAGLVVSAAPMATAAGTVVVDVQGAVARPGVQELPSGARVADAISAAGGYASDADLEASATAVNLAAPLTDGQQVRVPRVGDTTAVGGGAASGGADTGDGAAGGGGRVDLNTATPEELEALPGIGPVTVQKIVAARQERPFASLEDAVERGVINRGQLEEIRDAATAG